MRRLTNRANTVFDMTPLLDVIFIVLMVVMCNQLLGTREAQETIQDMSVSLEEAEAENELHKAQLETYENAESIVAYVTLHADYDALDRKTRHIRLAYDNDVTFEEIILSPETETEGYEKLRENMTDFLSGKAGMPVMLTLDQDRILYRDQVEISAMLKELAKEFGNLYLTEGQEE